VRRTKKQISFQISKKVLALTYQVENSDFHPDEHENVDFTSLLTTFTFFNFFRRGTLSKSKLGRKNEYQLWINSTAYILF